MIETVGRGMKEGRGGQREAPWGLMEGHPGSQTHFDLGPQPPGPREPRPRPRLPSPPAVLLVQEAGPAPGHLPGHLEGPAGGWAGSQPEVREDPRVSLLCFLGCRATGEGGGPGHQPGQARRCEMLRNCGFQGCDLVEAL